MYFGHQSLVNVETAEVLPLAQVNVSKYTIGVIRSVGGIAVSIVAFQAIDPGSTPGQRMYFFFRFLLIGILLYGVESVHAL